MLLELDLASGSRGGLALRRQRLLLLRSQLLLGGGGGSGGPGGGGSLCACRGTGFGGEGDLDSVVQLAEAVLAELLLVGLVQQKVDAKALSAGLRGEGTG